MRVCARVQIRVCPEPPLVFSHALLGGLRTGFLVVSSLRIGNGETTPIHMQFELHVYSSPWSEAEAPSEYGVVTE
jgi:hypothetical protein